MRYRAAVMLLLSLFCSTADAQIRTLFVVTKECPLNLLCVKQYGYGTCFAVARSARTGEYIYVTAGHNLKNSRGSGQVTGIEVGGVRARVVAGWVSAGTVDLGIVASKVTGTLMPVALSPPQKGETIKLRGYDYAASRTNPVLKRLEGTVTSLGTFAGSSVTTTTGMSGGPVLNLSGEAVGVIVYDTAFMVNQGGTRGLRGLVRHYFPDAEFAPTPARYVRSKNILPPPPMPKETEAVRQATSEELELAEKLRTATSELAAAREAAKVARRAPPEGTGASTGDAAVNVEPEKKTIIDRVEPVVGVVDTVLSNPWVSAAIIGATGGTGAAGLAGWQLLMAVRRRRKNRKTETDKPSPVAVPVATVVPQASGLAEDLASLTSRYEVQPDGHPEETFYKDAVRMVVQRHPDVDVLGGPVVARNILKQVAKMHAAAAGDNLSGV